MPLDAIRNVSIGNLCSQKFMLDSELTFDLLLCDIDLKLRSINVPSAQVNKLTISYTYRLIHASNTLVKYVLSYT